METTEQLIMRILNSKSDLAKQVFSCFYFSIRIIYISKGQKTENILCFIFHMISTFTPILGLYTFMKQQSNHALKFFWVIIIISINSWIFKMLRAFFCKSV